MNYGQVSAPSLPKAAFVSLDALKHTVCKCLKMTLMGWTAILFDDMIEADSV